jgi:lysophospholipase L1-like esterase
VLVATVPTQQGYTSIINALQGITVVHFDTALTISGAGSSTLTALYNNTDQQGNAFDDGLHPNLAGHAVMAARVLIDAPWLIN